MEGWVDLGVGYILRGFTCPQTVTHPGCNHSIATQLEVISMVSWPLVKRLSCCATKPPSVYTTLDFIAFCRERKPFWQRHQWAMRHNQISKQRLWYNELMWLFYCFIARIVSKVAQCETWSLRESSSGVVAAFLWVPALALYHRRGTQIPSSYYVSYAFLVNRTSLIYTRNILCYSKIS